MRTRDPEFRKYFAKSRTTDKAVESYLIDLENSTNDQVSFWSDYYEYFALEREKHLDEIKDAIQEAKKLDGEFKGYCRIVSSRYTGDPLCSLGSVQKKTNRFNFGKIKTSLTSFQALYIGENHSTAYLECYGREIGEKLGQEGYGAEILSLQPDPHSYNIVDVSIDTYIDITDPESLLPFVEIIKEIEIPEDFFRRAKKIYGNANLNVISNITQLKKALLYRNHGQWPVLLNQPSNPQWFGFYVWAAGITAILYPSVRSKFGKNIVVFPDNMENTRSSIRMVGDYPVVHTDRQFVDSSNCKLMQLPPADGKKH